MKVIIIGAVAAGMNAATQIKKYKPKWEVKAYDQGSFSSYGMCGLPYYIAGLTDSIDNLIAITPEEFEKKRDIKVFIKHQVLKINPGKKTINVLNLVENKIFEESYDFLMIASGAKPIVPKGLENDKISGVFYLNTLEDGPNILNHIKNKKAKTALVIGAGYIGLEVAEALKAQNLEVKILSREPLPTFEPEIRTLILDELKKQKVEFIKGDALGFKETTDEKILVKNSVSDDIKADLVVVGIGINPSSELAAEANLTLGHKKAIWVDRNQKSSDPFIYSAGDCAEDWHILSKKNTYIPLALGASRQGRIAGQNIVGKNVKFPGVLGTAGLKAFDLGICRTGFGLEEALNLGFENATKVIVKQHSKPKYYPNSSEITVIVIYDKKTGRLLGAQMAGKLEGVAQRINTFALALNSGLTVKELANLDTVYAPPFSPVYDPIIIACEIAAKSLSIKINQKH